MDIPFDLLRHVHVWGVDKVVPQVLSPVANWSLSIGIKSVSLAGTGEDSNVTFEDVVKSCVRCREHWFVMFHPGRGAGGSTLSRECLCRLGPRWKLNYCFFVRTWWSHLGNTHNVIALLDSWDKGDHCRWVPQTGSIKALRGCFSCMVLDGKLIFYRCRNLRLLHGGESLTPWTQRHISPKTHV